MIASAGVDTWSVAWYLEPDSKPARAMEALATERAARSRLMPEAVAGHRIGWFPGQQLLFAEGHPRDGELAASTDLPDAFGELTEQLSDRGILPPEEDARHLMPSRPKGGVGFAGIRRLDSTVDLHLEDAAHGMAALAGIAALPFPRTKKKVHYEVSGPRVESVYLLGYSGKRVLGRWYDKGIESKTAPRGRLLRPEDQRRFTAETRPTLEAVAESTFVRDAFVRRFEPLWKAAKGVKVGTAVKLAERAAELVEEEVLTPAEAQRIVGHLCLDASGRAEELFPRSTFKRHRREARESGLVLADGVIDEVEIDLGEILEEALDSEAWGASG